MENKSVRPRKYSWTFILGVVFVSASVMDLILTHALLQTDGIAYEANPLAARILRHFGWLGLIAFKATAVTVVVGVALLIARSRPRLARKLLCVASAVVVAIVMYSASLFAQVDAVRAHPEMQKHRLVLEKLDKHKAEMGRYFKHLGKLAKQLIYEEISLSDAVKDLKKTTKTFNKFKPSEVLASLCLQHYGHDDIYLAIHLVQRIGVELTDESYLLRRKCFERMSGQFRSFHSQLPWFAVSEFRLDIAHGV